MAATDSQRMRHTACPRRRNCCCAILGHPVLPPFLPTSLGVSVLQTPAPQLLHKCPCHRSRCYCLRGRTCASETRDSPTLHKTVPWNLETQSLPIWLCLEPQLHHHFTGVESLDITTEACLHSVPLIQQAVHAQTLEPQSLSADLCSAPQVQSSWVPCLTLWSDCHSGPICSLNTIAPCNSKQACIPSQEVSP